VFNDGAFSVFTDKQSKEDTTLFMKDGEPLVFGENGSKGIRLNGTRPEVVQLGAQWTHDDLWIHDSRDAVKAHILSRFFDPVSDTHFPRPFGIFYQEDRPTYEDLLNEQIAAASAQLGSGDLDAIIRGRKTWEIQA
jgi:2-oxoglutarate ferredoxin oxidoreductase subunit beta